MSLLQDHQWKPTYNSDDLKLVSDFYVPALRCASRYDRATGYFSARALTLAARGVEGLVRNTGTMRLLVGCTLDEAEVQAIEKGESLKNAIESKLRAMPILTVDAEESEALELISWMIAKGYLHVKVAVPCDKNKKPCPSDGIFHDKSGIIEDKVGDRLAFNGSVNETAKGWAGNWEKLTVFWDYGDGDPYVDGIENDFVRLWRNEAKRALVVDIPEALEKDLLKFLPPDDKKPTRLEDEQPEPSPEPEVPDEPEVLDEPEDLGLDPFERLRRLAWGLIRYAPAYQHGGERVGEATSVITPWPHQIRAFQRMYESWPPKVLIADEVGLGKTIEAGMVLRQAWLAGRAKRILILAPKAILTQWQIELREKFNLNWPVYDGRDLSWYPTRALGEAVKKKVGKTAWHKEPCVITSSQLMRRGDRATELLENAEPWDLVVLDEAHHARRRGVGGAKERGPNQLLRLAQRLQERTQGLVLLTATPMQVHPVEVWDLLSLLGLPESWSSQAFVKFFDKVAQGNPSHEELEELARLFRAAEAHFGETKLEDARRFVPGGSKLVTKKILSSLRDNAKTARKTLSTDRRRAALQIMKANTPVARLISRHTRGLLRRYFEAGKISTPIATRKVEDVFVELTIAERDIYEAVEDYISTTYNSASAKQRNAVGFVMTIYRRRLASSFAALERTLSQHLDAMDSTAPDLGLNEENVSDDELADEAMDAEEVNELEREALMAEERTDIEYLLESIRKLPTDTKATILFDKIAELREAGYEQVLVFTQYTDTLDFLRTHLKTMEGLKVMCFSGRGGEVPSADGSWRRISRDDTKRRFREGAADVLLCTDAAAEGLNFQFCGALINYDMPWNPMKVEQRIGRIDRLGQAHENIQIVNLHYDDTVETDVYRALRDRIGLFSQFVGKLQPILSQLPKSIGDTALKAPRPERDRMKAELVSKIDDDVRAAQQGGFDIDAITDSDLEAPPRPTAAYDLKDLDSLIKVPELLPPGMAIKRLGKREYSLSMPGMSEPLRVTTDPEFFEEHPESAELWAPGSPLFPDVEMVAEPEELATAPTLAVVVETARTKEKGGESA